MNKFNEFYTKLNEDSNLKKEVSDVLGNDKFENLSEEKMLRIGEIAQKAGFDFTLDEVMRYFSGGELDDDDLDAVAGGKGDSYEVRIEHRICEIGGSAEGS